MRKADYATLAGLVRGERAAARKTLGAPTDDPHEHTAADARRQTAERIARQFAEQASVDRAEFLAACGLSP